MKNLVVQLSDDPIYFLRSANLSFGFVKSEKYVNDPCFILSPTVVVRGRCDRTRRDRYPGPALPNRPMGSSFFWVCVSVGPVCK